MKILDIKEKLKLFIDENFIISKKNDLDSSMPFDMDEPLMMNAPMPMRESVSMDVPMNASVSMDDAVPREVSRKNEKPKRPGRKSKDSDKEHKFKLNLPGFGSKKEAARIDDFIDNSYEGDAVAKRLNLYMYERDITTAMIYERCYVDRKLISKITSNSNYHPSKNTMLALCIGLRLNLEEGEEFIALAGYSFSNASKYDLIIKFVLKEEIYDLDVINELLYQYDQPCLGA